MKKMLRADGFTLIELLVVIVILGILSTIGFANFKGYYASAFNSERKAAVKAMATMVKVDAAAEIGSKKYKYVEDLDSSGSPKLSELFDDNDYKVPSIQDNKCYVYVYHEVGGSAGANNEFVILTALEDGTIQADGTKAMVTAAEGIVPSTGFNCAGAFVLPGYTFDVDDKILYLCTDATVFDVSQCAGQEYDKP